jgi:glucosamine--fructose-6-phosphate aminotransferase (isomerizing)
VVADLKIIEGQYLHDLLDQPSALLETLDAVDPPKELVNLARHLNRGKFERIVLTGMGSSFHALHPLDQQLISHGFTSIMVETSELIHYKAELIDPKTLIVAVSQSGMSAEVVRMAKINRHRSAVIAVTNTAGSHLAEHAAATLLTRAGSEFSVSCKTYVTALVALKRLGDILCERDARHSLRHLKSTVPAVSAYLGNWRAHVAELGEMMKGNSHLFLVGRGGSLAAAGAGALIIKESDHFHAEGMSSAAFRHGPFEMLSAETFVVVFSGDRKTRDLNHRLLADIRKTNGRAELIGESSSPDCFRLADCEPSVRAILEILPAQMITLALAALAGREAGKFERATKITATE